MSYPLTFIDSLSTAGSPVQYTPEYVLNPLAIFRMARKDICDKEKHAPEGSCASSPPGNTPLLPIPIDDMVTSPFPTTEMLFDNSQMAHYPRPDGIEEYQQLPTSFDDLQTYLPLMLNNFSLPIQDGFGNVPADGSIVDFGDASIYPPPPPGVPGEFAAVSLAPESFQPVTTGASWPP